ncbi:MAG TPA: hypothetical protein VNY75_02740, partial [Rhizomicrobium sp.]|nr:hypothetical protein [Rhizomicrobium sp.]
MFHRYAKSALICAQPPIALFASGCIQYAKSALICAVPPIVLSASICIQTEHSESNTAVSSNPGSGERRFGAFAAGNYSQSKLDCTNDYHNHADSPLTGSTQAPAR